MRAFLILLASAWLGSAAMAASPEEAYREAAQRLSAEFDGMDAEREAPAPAVKAYWDAVDGLLSARGPNGLAAEAKSNQFVAVKTVSLGKDVVAVSVSNDQLGHLAVLDQGRVRWASSTDPSTPGCWHGAPERPCAGYEIGLLPIDSAGAPRFYVTAGYAQDAGGTRGYQLSFWRWKNGKAEFFHKTDFATAGDAPQGVTVAGDDVKIIGKGHWEHFGVCGGCEGRQQTHHLRVTATSVEDLGFVSLEPNLDAIDELLGRLADKRPTTDLASPEAAAVLKRSWRGNIFLSIPPDIEGSSACLAPEELPALTFRFGPGPKTTKIVAVEPGPCP